MLISEKVIILKNNPLFKDFSDNELEDIATLTHEKIFVPKELILDQSKPASAVYLIYKGLVQIYMLTFEGKIIPIRVKESPYIVGEMNLFDNESTASIEAIQETHTLLIPKKLCIKLLNEKPFFAIALLKTINEKLRAANKETHNFFTSRLKDRTVQVLNALSPHFADNAISLSQEELALIVGASRARVTEILDELASEKVIRLSRRKISLL